MGRAMLCPDIGEVDDARRATDRWRAAVADPATRQRLDEEFERLAASEVTESLGELKGAPMKLGQMASYLDEGMPDAMRQALAGLRQDAPPMPSDLALTEIERSLGRPLHTLFRDIDPDPIAAASIGQVHRAVTAGGRCHQTTRAMIAINAATAQGTNRTPAACGAPISISTASRPPARISSSSMRPSPMACSVMFLNCRGRIGLPLKNCTPML